MTITLDENYNAKTDTTTLGYVGEINARIITFEGYQCEDADSYKMRFKYPDGVTYDVDISGGTYTMEGSILRCVGNVYVQVLACKQNGDNYEYVKKSNIMTMHVDRSLNGNVTSVPTYEQSVGALEKVFSAEKSSTENAQKSVTASSAAQAAQNAAETAKEMAEKLVTNAEKAAENAAQSETAAQTAADTATYKAAEVAESAEQIQKNTADIAKLYSKSDGIVCEAEGSAIVLTDSSELPFNGMRIFGQSEQNGTPSPDNPVPIVSVGDSNQIIVTVSDNADNVQTLTLSTPNGLPGIPVDSGGNYTDDNGQQWICDEINLVRGVKVRRIMEEDILLQRIEYSNPTGYRYMGTPSMASNSTFCMCDKFEYSAKAGLHDKNDGNGIRVAPAARVIVAQSKETIIENETCNVKLKYILANPIETPLSAEEISAYKSLHTNKPTTTITNSNSAHMAVSYTADTKTYIDNKFAELQTAIISIGGNI